MAYLPLHAGWTVRPVGGPVPASVHDAIIPASVPGCVHTDLLAADLILDPFDADNEAEQQWIGRTAWQYEMEFDWRDDGSDRYDLVAEGLDTVATIDLNGAVVGRTENQHRGHRFDVAPLLRAGANSLAITFAAPVDEAERRSADHGPRPHANHHPYNTLRKAAFNFGWDWGIDAATSGIWKPIGLESWSTVRISSVRPIVDLAPGPDGVSGVLEVRVALEWAGAPAAGAVPLSASVGGVTGSVSVAPGTNESRIALEIPNVDVWWPIGHGDQPLYDLEVRVDGGSSEVQKWNSRVGFRTVRVETEPDAGGSPFTVIVNDTPVQVRGANWIPDHAFVTEIDGARYRRRVRDAVEANMNLLRVWGGGIYESDEFYDACDEAGILVWQDFLFACGAYAEEDWLAVEVEAEAREAIARLSPHPSLVIWNGNNENIWGHEDWGWREPLAGRTWGDSYYHELLPRLVAELDPSRPYSPGSPYSFSPDVHPNDAAHGTMHIWDVWNSLDYREYARHQPRFASEFGFQGPPAWTTLVDVVHDEPLDAYGPQMLVHQKAEDGDLKLERGMRGHLPEPRTVDDWHWATQLNQAAAVRFGVEHFRSLAPLNSGVIVWQLNDSWPVISWAAVDFAERRKPLWFALRDAYRSRLATFQPRSGSLALVVLNDSAEAWSGDVVLQRCALDGTILARAVVPSAVTARGQTTVAVPANLAAFGDASREILTAALDGFEAAIHHPVEIVEQALDPDPVDVVAVRDDDAPEVMLVTVTARSLTRDITLLVDRVHPDARADRGMVTLLAGERATFRVTAPAAVDPANLVTPLVLRHANGLLKDLRTEGTAR